MKYKSTNYCDWFLCLFHSTILSASSAAHPSLHTYCRGIHKLVFMLCVAFYLFTLFFLVFWSRFCFRCCWGGDRSLFPMSLLPCWAKHPKSSVRMHAGCCFQTERASLHKPGWGKGRKVKSCSQNHFFCWTTK